MASKSLGTLTLDLVARIGGFEAGLGKAEREAKKRADAIEKAFDGAFSAISAGFLSVAAAGTAALALINNQADGIAAYQDLADKIGDTAVQIASLQQAATISGVALDTVAAASVKLTASLAKTDDESKAVGQAIKAMGLEFDAFKELSPVEQLDAVAQALAGFQDGAEKTAVAVALFGRSGAELIPFLTDLGEQTERNSALTADQIAATDEYTKATARLKAEFDAFIQQQTAQLIPTLSGVQSALAEIAKNEQVVEAVTAALNTVIKAAIVLFQAVVVVSSDVIFVFQGVGREIGAILAQLGALARLDFSGFRAISEAVKEDGVRARAELDRFQKQIMSIGQPAYMDDETRRLMARSASNVPARPRLNIAGLSSGGGGARAGGGGRRSSGGGGSSIDQAQRYLEGLQKQLERTQDLTVSEQVLKDIQLGRLGAVSEAQKTALLEVAGQIDASKQLAEVEKERQKAEAEAAKQREELNSAGQQLFNETRTAIEDYSMSMDRLNVLLSAGAISMDTYDRAALKLGQTLEATKKPIDEAANELDEFSKKAAESIQDAIGDGLVDIMEGNFDDIGKSFGKMLTRMAAEAVAADIARLLFGGSAKGGSGEGWLSGLLSAFGGSMGFGGGKANGGPVAPGTLYRVNERGPEMFQSANGSQFLMTGSSGGNITPNHGLGGAVYNTTINVPPQTTRQSGSQLAAEYERKMAQGRRNN